MNRELCTVSELGEKRVLEKNTPGHALSNNKCCAHLCTRTQLCLHSAVTVPVKSMKYVQSFSSAVLFIMRVR